MLTITDSAKNHLYLLLSNNGIHNDYCIRLTAEDAGMRLEPDSIQPNDQTFTHQTRTILTVSENSLAKVKGKTLDVQVSKDGSKLAIV